VVQSDRAANLLSRAQTLRDEENAAYLETRDLEKQKHQADVTQDKIEQYHAKTALEAAERKRQNLFKQANDVERELHDEQARSTAQKTQADRMFSKMQDSTTATQQRRDALASATIARDACETEAKRKGLAADDAQRNKDTVAKETAEIVKLPVLENEVESGPFFEIAPWLMVVMFVYLRLYLAELHSRLGTFDSWASEQGWSLRRRTQVIHPWVGTFAYYGNPVAVAAMLISATWGTPCALALMYSWRHDSYTLLAFAVSAVLAAIVCIETRSPSGVCLSDAANRSAPRMARLAVWGVWAIGLAVVSAFILARFRPDYWQMLTT